MTDVNENEVRVSEYDPDWADQFESLAAMLSRALARIDAEVVHVGSTSVPGLAPKRSIVHVGVPSND